MIRSSNGKLYIKGQTFSEILNYVIIFLPFTFGFFIEFVGMPTFVKYIIDLAWITLTVILISRRITLSKPLIPLAILVCGFLLYTFILYLCNFQSPFYYLWGLRNNFRFYFAFLAFVTFFSEENADGCLKAFDIIFWFNAAVSFVQYFFLGYKQDYLGGIFGVERGCNAYLIIFFTIIISKSVLSFMNKEESAWYCFLKCVVTLMICAFAELKFFFVLFIIILVISMFLTAFSWRKFAIILGGTVLITVCSSLLVTLFGFEDFLSVRNLWSVATQSSYSTAQDLNRLSAIPTISRTILTDTPSRLFGMGLGNCDTSSFAICNTPFYQTYSELHYTWISSAFLFLETGYIGLILCISFFVAVFVQTLRVRKLDSVKLLYSNMAIIMSFICIILIVYNASMRTEVAYMAYFVLALPFIPIQKTVRILAK